jgi:hypothetical protein
MKECNKCRELKDLSDFYYIAKQEIYRGTCRDCRLKDSKAYHLKNKDRNNAQSKDYYYKHKDSIESKRIQKHIDNPGHRLFYSAKHRAKKRGLHFDLEFSDVIVPEYCPVFNLKLTPSTTGNNDSSPTLDRLDSTLGYIKGNVNVISMKANRTKNDATIEELTTLVAWLKLQ